MAELMVNGRCTAGALGMPVRTVSDVRVDKGEAAEHRPNNRQNMNIEFAS